MKHTDADQVQWFCLKSLPKHEHIAAAHLGKMDEVEVFCPRLRYKRSTRRGVVWWEEAMFPGYLFARFHLLNQHKEVRYASGINSILRFGSEYAVIEAATIQALREQTNGQQVVTIDPELKAGDSVKIVEGALHGLEAVVTQVLSGSERVRVLLNFLGREIQAEVKAPAVLTAKRHPLST